MHCNLLQENFRDTGNFTTLPQYFRQQGYTTVSAGKVGWAQFNGSMVAIKYAL